MIVYHGSYTEIKEVDLNRSEPYKDFGQGFYVTKFKPQAETWATRKSKFKHNGFITEFEFSFNELVKRNCKIKHFETYNEEWLDFVVLNRNENNPIPAHDYDMVEGPVADDKIQNRINDYLDGIISKQQFLSELIHNKENHQICFCTTASLVYLKRKDNTKEVSKFLHIGEPIAEKLVEVFGFDEETAMEKFYSSEIFSKLADTSTELYNKNWTEIYELLLEELNLKPN